MHPIVKTVGGLSASLPSGRVLRLTRRFDAPRQLVWDAHTQPHLIRRWLLGPPGWTMPVCEVDLRVGGAYRYAWRSDDGRTMAMSGTYRIVEAPHVIADTQRFDDDWTQGPADTHLTLSEQDGRTLLVLEITYASQAVRDFALSLPMMDGMEAGYARLDTAARA